MATTNASSQMSTAVNIEDYDAISELIKASESDPTKIKSLFEGTYASIKTTVSILLSLADFDNKYATTLDAYKTATSFLMGIFLKPLIADCKKHQEKQEVLSQKQPEVLAKWWSNYLSILQQTYNRKKTTKGWEGKKNEDWFTESEKNMLNESIDVLVHHNHWKKQILRGCCAKKVLLIELKVYNEEQLDNMAKEFKEYALGLAIKAVDSIKKSKKKGEKMFIFSMNLLEGVIAAMQNDKFQLASLLSGYFDHKKYNEILAAEGDNKFHLKHSVIFGDDGGYYALVNTIDSDEFQMFLETGKLTKDYLEGITKEVEGDLKKIIIGKGSFGTIRISVSLNTNVTSQLLQPGELICVKKTGYVNKKIIKEGVEDRIIKINLIYENAWNDYLSGEIGNLIFSPDVYDMKIIDSIDGIDENHQKGYTLQKFVPVSDGSRVFGTKGKYAGIWIHQKCYLMDIFDVTLKLLKTGICMTDKKPENTLYNGEDNRGMLIDLAGVVRKKDPKLLKECKLDDIKEFTVFYTAPEILDNLKKEKEEEEEGDEGEYEEEPEEIVKVDLNKCMSFSLGKMIKEVVLNQPNKYTFKAELEKLAAALTKADPEERMSLADGRENFSKIGAGAEDEKLNFQPFIDALLKSTLNDLKKYGLNPKMQKIKDSFIDIKNGYLDPVKYPDIDVFPLRNTLECYIYKRPITAEKEIPFKDEKVMVLLGNSGSGKSTILQIMYVENLMNWKEGQPIPFFINLSVEDDLERKWKWVCEQIKDYSVPFNVFSGFRKYPLNLYVDSFDEVAFKINYVSKFLENQLNNNPVNRILICCRSEFIQKDSDYPFYFKPEHSDYNSFTKRFIAPLNEKTGFNFDTYIKKYFEIWGNTANLKIEDVIVKVREKNLLNFMKTGYMVHLTLEVLPEIMASIDEVITRRKIFQKYTRKNINKLEPEARVFFLEQFKPDPKIKIEPQNSCQRCIEEAGMILAKHLHIKGTSKLHNENCPSFFQKYLHDPNTTCFENGYLSIVFRALDLNVEFRGVTPHEVITIGLAHDTIKNYFLTMKILEEAGIDSE